jgi:peptide chain release factor 2
MTVFQQDIDNLVGQIKLFLDSADLEAIQKEISKLEEKISDPGIWDEPTKGALIQKQLNFLIKEKNKFQKLNDLADELEIAGQLNEENLVDKTFIQAKEFLRELENIQYLNGKFDNYEVLLSVHAGAGGVDAEDWAAMLVNMYQSFCKNQSWDCQIVELSSGDEGGVKTATLKINGDKTYGILKEEFGVHRLVRLSPFNSAHTRETSFALVEVMPIGAEEEFKLNIEEKDLKWDYFMAGGHGGQSVNTTYSAVRVTHIPTKISVVCQNERSQVQNKQMALKYLKAKLAMVEAEKQAELRQELRGSWQSAEWGNQIRSYVLHPYKMVKDLRSNWETSNIEEVLEKGNILPIIWSVKQKSKK